MGRAVISQKLQEQLWGACGAPAPSSFLRAAATIRFVLIREQSCSFLPSLLSSSAVLQRWLFIYGNGDDGTWEHTAQIGKTIFIRHNNSLVVN